MSWDAWDEMRKRDEERRKRDDDRRQQVLKEQKARDAAKLARKEREAKKQKEEDEYREKQKKVQAEYDKQLKEKTEEKKAPVVRLSRGFGPSAMQPGGAPKHHPTSKPGSPTTTASPSPSVRPVAPRLNRGFRF
jgi:hypothetical protein